MLTVPLPDRTVCPCVTASASDSVAPRKEGIFTYRVIEGNNAGEKSIMLCVCDPDVTEVIIPSTIEGIPVTHISMSAFEKCTAMTSVTLPDTIESIDPFAFSKCSSLREVVIPPTLYALAKSTFVGSPWWDELCKENDYIIINNMLLAVPNRNGSSCVVPEGVTRIADYALSYDKELTWRGGIYSIL